LFNTAQWATVLGGSFQIGHALAGTLSTFEIMLDAQSEVDRSSVMAW
jgi:hypothetical protein